LAELVYKKLGNVSSEAIVTSLQNDGLVLSLEDMTEEQRACLPRNDQFIQSIETYLKYAEADGSIELEHPVAKIASVETYLKYSEGVAADEKVDIIASVETSLKYAEAAPGGFSSYPKVIASIETYLKYAEAAGLTQARVGKKRQFGSNFSASEEVKESRIVVSGIETYLKYGEAVGLTQSAKVSTKNLMVNNTYSDGFESRGYKSSVETYLKLAEAIGIGTNFFDSNINKGIYSDWSAASNDKGLIVDIWGRYMSLSQVKFWSTSNPLLPQILFPETEDAFQVLLSKGLVIDGGFNKSALQSIGWVNTKNENLKSYNMATSSELNIGDRLLDKGLVYTENAPSFAELMRSDRYRYAERFTDKGIVGDYYSISGPIFNSLTTYKKSVDDSERILDKGFVVTSNVKSILDAFILSRVLEYDQVLDSGLIYIYSEDSVKIYSTELYLKMVEALM
jgi:hypothetical protein